MPVHWPVRLRFLILVAAIDLCLIGWPVEPLSSIGIRGPGGRSPGSKLTLTIIRHNHARNRFGPGSGRQKPGARGMRNEAIYLFVFIGLNKAGAAATRSALGMNGRMRWERIELNCIGMSMQQH